MLPWNIIFLHICPQLILIIFLWIYLEMNSSLILNNSASDEQLSKNRTEVQISLLEWALFKMWRKGMIWQHFAMCTQKAFIAWATQKASTSTYCARAPPTALTQLQGLGINKSVNTWALMWALSTGQVDNILSQTKSFILHGEQWAILQIIIVTSHTQPASC